MLREYRGSVPHYECAASGSVLTIAGSEYDLDELQTDSQRIVDIIIDDMYAANIIIPPAAYKTVTIDDEETTEMQPVELGRVKIILWTKPEETETNDNDN